MEAKINLTTVSEPVVRWVETYAKCNREIAEELNRFMMERFRRNIEMWGSVTQRDRPASLFEAQERWMSTAIRDYTDEGQRLVQLSGELLQGCLTQMQQAAHEVDKPVAIRTNR